MAAKKPKQDVVIAQAPVLTSYSVSMTIRTAEYSNVIIGFTFDGENIEDAILNIDDKIDAMHKKYYNFLEKKVEVKESPISIQKEEKANVFTRGAVDTEVVDTTKSEAFQKAWNIIKSAKTPEALAQIKANLTTSTKPYLYGEKEELFTIIDNRTF